MKIVSKYKNNSLASTKKHIYSRLLDYFTVFVITFLIFSVTYGLVNYIPGVNKLHTDISNVNNEIANYIDSTHLQRFNKDKTSLLSVDDTVGKYVETLAKSSAYIHDLDFPSKQEDGTYIENKVNIEETFFYNPMDYELDPVSYFAKIFKKSEDSLNNYIYDGVDYKDDIDTYIYIKIMNVNVNYYLSETDPLISSLNGVSRFNVLNKTSTESIIRNFKYDTSDITIFNDTHFAYSQGIRYFIEDIENNSSVYNSFFDEFDILYQRIVLIMFLIYLITYLVCYVAYILITRLIYKEWCTLGNKILKLSLTDINEMEPGVYNLLAYYISTFILSFTSSLIAFMFMGMMGVISLNIVGGFTLSYIYVALITLNIISLFLPMFTKGKHDLSTLIAKIAIKDTTEFDVNIASEIKMNEGNNSGK